MNNQNWDDIRYVLSVAKHGSLNAAATALGVTHATVMRRVAAFESRYNCQIFEKSLSGYSVLPEAVPVLKSIENVDEAVLAVERVIAGADQSPSGQVRVASTDSLCQVVLPPIIAKIAMEFPKLRITLLSANVHHDLSRLTADIVVRPAALLASELSGQQAGYLSFGVYSDGAPSRKWLSLEGALDRSLAAQWMSDNVDQRETIEGADSFLVLQQMVASGIGKALLPTVVGDTDSRLIRVEEDNLNVSVPVWVATLKEFARTPRFAFVQKLIAENLNETLLSWATQK